MFLEDGGVLGKTTTTKTGGCFLSFFIFKFNNHFFYCLTMYSWPATIPLYVTPTSLHSSTTRRRNGFEMRISNRTSPTLPT